MGRKYSRSPSQLKSYTRCGEAFRLERIIKIPRRPGAYTVLGIAIHEAFSRWELDHRREDVVDLFRDAWEVTLEHEMDRQPDLRFWMKTPRAKNVETDITNYFNRGLEKDVPWYRDRCLAAEWEILELPDGARALELPFELELAGIPIRGVLDRIQWWPNLSMAAVEDIKSGSPDDEIDVRQLALYRLAAGEVYDIDLTHGRYWYTKLDRPGEWIDLRRYTREYLEKTYVTLDEAISKGVWLPRPGKHCDLCGARPWCRELGWLQEGEPLFDVDSETNELVPGDDI